MVGGSHTYIEEPTSLVSHLPTRLWQVLAATCVDEEVSDCDAREVFMERPVSLGSGIVIEEPIEIIKVSIELKRRQVCGAAKIEGVNQGEQRTQEWLLATTTED